LYLSPLVKIKQVNKKSLSGVFLIFCSFVVIDALVNSSSFVGTYLGGVFESMVGFYGSVALILMLIFLGLYLIFSNKFLDIFKFSFTYFKDFHMPNLKKGSKEKTEENDLVSQLDFNFEEDLNAVSEEVTTPSENIEPAKAAQKQDFEIVESLSEPVELVKSGSANKAVSSLAEETPDEEEPTPAPITNAIWEYPPLDILKTPENTKVDVGNTEERKQIIEKTLASFGIKSQVVSISTGPAVTQYALKVDEGTKTSRITNLQNDLALALASPNGQVRIEAPIPGKSLIGVEVPNLSQQIVNLKPLFSTQAYKTASSKSKLTLVLGKDVSGRDSYYPLNRMPHLLVAGATGSGKSGMIQSIITSILFTNSPDECKFIMVDPKRVELGLYNDIPHLITPVITEPSEAVNALKWVVGEMDKRLHTLSSMGAKNIDSYNEKSGFQAMPYIVVIIDELADLMMTSSNEVERYIVRIAQLSRATGIHLVLATQRPSTDIITGSIKANVPARVAFSVASQVDSRVIIDTGGAEKLLGKGDMLFVSPESSKPVRIQGVWVEDEETNKLVSYLKASSVEPNYNNAITQEKPANSSASGSASWEDELFPEAVNVVVEYGRGSASLLQRRLSIGYARAARLLDELEENGVVSVSDGSKSREVLIDSAEDVLG
jgi:S-DNA-T family DNA segregation ATPase FtsK/SpoIIIE